jgi:hypothetical protein
MNELKNCPHCGGKAKTRYRMPLSWVECKNKKCRARTEVVCDDYMQRDGMAEVEQMWNNG